jgi:DNA primase
MINGQLVTTTEKITFIERSLGKGKLARNSLNFEIWCPFCRPMDANKRKLVIRIDDDRNHCWTCGFKARSLVPLLRKFSSKESLVEYIERFMPQLRAVLDEKASTAEEIVTLPNKTSLLIKSKDDNPNFAAVYQYVKKRGLTDDDCWRYKICCSLDFQWNRRVIVPSFDQYGKLNYFVGRAIDDNVRPKYDNPRLDVNKRIFNESNIDWSSELMLCEGVFDMFKCIDNTIPVLGSNLDENSLLFNMIVMNCTPIVLAFDADMWHTKTLRLAKKLSEYNVTVKILDTREFDDPGKATKKQIKDALKVAKQFDWRHAFLTKLEKAMF